MYHVSCIMYHASCIMYHASCIMYHASFIMYHVSCIMYGGSLLRQSALFCTSLDPKNEMSRDGKKVAFCCPSSYRTIFCGILWLSATPPENPVLMRMWFVGAMLHHHLRLHPALTLRSFFLVPFAFSFSFFLKRFIIQKRTSLMNYEEAS